MWDSDSSGAQPDFEEIDHTADWAFRIRGRDLRELLVNAARGLSGLLVEDLEHMTRDIRMQIELEAEDAEGLLVQWLSELAYRAEVEGLIFAEYDVEVLEPFHVEARVRGGHTDAIQKHVKAVTYHNLAVLRTHNGLEATVVLDV